MLAQRHRAAMQTTLSIHILHKQYIASDRLTGSLQYEEIFLKYGRLNERWFSCWISSWFAA